MTATCYFGHTGWSTSFSTTYETLGHYFWSNPVDGRTICVSHTASGWLTLLCHFKKIVGDFSVCRWWAVLESHTWCSVLNCSSSPWVWETNMNLKWRLFFNFLLILEAVPIRCRRLLSLPHSLKHTFHLKFIYNLNAVSFLVGTCCRCESTTSRSG